MGAAEQADSLDEEEVPIVMEISEVVERGRKDKLPALRNVPKKVDKVLSKFKTLMKLFYTGAVVVTNRSGVNIDKVVGERNQCRRVCKIR